MDSFHTWTHIHTHIQLTHTMPIHKGGKKTESLNYRPVSLSSVVGKVCKIMITNNWEEYLVENKIINNSQFGFRKGKLCITNLLNFYTRVVDEVLGRGGWVGTVYLDIKKTHLTEYRIKDSCGR